MLAKFKVFPLSKIKLMMFYLLTKDGNKVEVENSNIGDMHRLEQNYNQFLGAFTRHSSFFFVHHVFV